jgi:hypothetical protein
MWCCLSAWAGVAVRSARWVAPARHDGYRRECRAGMARQVTGAGAGVAVRLCFVGRLSADFDVDLDGNAIGDHVVDGRPAAGLLDDLAEHVFGGVPLDSELDRDLLVAVAHRL